MSIPWGSTEFAVFNFGIISFAFKPAFSAKILGIISNDNANLLKEY